jgi:hypothetical protein
MVILDNKKALFRPNRFPAALVKKARKYIFRIDLGKVLLYEFCSSSNAF